MAQLNSEQKRAVNTLRGPMLVLAGAGTGKTRVVTYRIARLIQAGVDPTRILAVTFTNKAAREMQGRIAELLGRRKKKKPQISTFHSHCVQILRRHAPRLGYPRRFVIYGTSDQESLARQVLKQVHIADTDLKPRDVLYWISKWKAQSIRAEDAELVASGDRAALAARCYARYQRELKNLGAVDFDDLLLLTEDLFQMEREVVADEAARFDHILIDEYQDTNTSQYRIVRKLASTHRNLCVVGDDDQSIYAWRGAQVQHILNFQKDWPEAELFCLEENYRSTAAILDYANRLIRNNSLRHSKRLRSDREGGKRPAIQQFPDETREATEVVAEIARRLPQPGTQPSDFAVLFRTGEQSRPFETELRKRRIPYVLIGGQSFFDRREIKDVLAFLRLIETPEDDIALRRILNTPPRGVGQKARDALIEYSLRESCSLWQAARRQPPAINEHARKGLQRLVTAIERASRDSAEALSNGQTKKLVTVATRLLDVVDYRSEIERQYESEDEQETRWASVEQLINALATYVQQAEQPSFGQFIDELALNEREIDTDKDKKLQQNAVVLLTMHSSKGLEYPHVYIVGMEEGILPHRKSIEEGEKAIEEERRLCYVGVTRAQESLTLSLALSRMKWGRPQARHPSRFLYEMTGQLDHPNYQRCLAGLT